MTEYNLKDTSQPLPAANRVVLVLDSEFLARQTFGELSLQTEILQLFRAQLGELVSHLTTAQSAEDWHFALHTLKGAAASVGAVELAQLADRQDAQEFPSDQAKRSQAAAHFEEAQLRFLQAMRARAN